MFTSVSISNYRGFKKLEVKGLSRVNLVVGQNNAGKTAFLEAVKLLTCDKLSDFFRMLVLRLQNIRQRNSDEISREKLVDCLFYGFKIPDNDEGDIHLTSRFGRKIASIKIAIKKGNINNVRSVQLEFENIEENILCYEYKAGKYKRNYFLPLERVHREGRFPRYENELRRKELISSVWVGSKTRINSELVNLYDQAMIDDVEFEQEVVEGLKLIDPKIMAIRFAEDPKVPYVQVKGLSHLIPISSFGEGTTRILHIIIAMANAKNGVLCIDEFENGLHWTIQPKLWDIIFRLSKKLKVQVFATTHSKDAVDSFTKIWEGHKKDGNFLRLDRKDGDIRAMSYSYAELQASLEVNVEVR